MKKIYLSLIKVLYSALNITFDDNESFHDLNNHFYEKTKKKISEIELVDTNSEMVNLLDHLKHIRSAFHRLEHRTNVSVSIDAISEIYIRIGYFKAQLFGQIPLIDPKEKKGLRRKYCLETIQTFEKMKQSFEIQNMIYTDKDKPIHDFHHHIQQNLGKIEEDLQKLDKYVAVRPIDASYRELRMVCI